MSVKAGQAQIRRQKQQLVGLVWAEGLLGGAWANTSTTTGRISGVRHYLKPNNCFPHRLPELPSRPAAIDQDRLSRDQRRRRGREEHDGPSDVGRLADAMETGDPLDHVGPDERIAQV